MFHEKVYHMCADRLFKDFFVKNGYKNGYKKPRIVFRHLNAFFYSSSLPKHDTTSFILSEKNTCHTEV